METEGCEPPNTGGSVDARCITIGNSHGLARSFSSSPPAFGDILPSFVQGLKVTLCSGMLLVINKGGSIMSSKKVPEVAGKGKGVIADNMAIVHLKKSIFLGIMETKYDFGQAVAETEMYSQENIASVGNVKNNFDLNKVRECNNIELELCKESKTEITETLKPNIQQNAWSKKEHIEVVHLDLGNFISEDGAIVKLHEDKVIDNYNRLQNSIVIKVFGSKTPFPVVSNELRRKWASYGKFHLTMLGLD
ncbi:hypothetical protein MA16_Dca024743 [Dendrobium catenatum]|uniref:Uncharacterized protein n=1 Tax=Dendrobium catenatum TaxID=906689 RepID=A0A2I0WG40_9ASPA|nr:hypothetical protein MA16_Dca024743 [Dendrobium catenatum]